MADNVELNAGTGGDTIAADDIAGVKHQRVKTSLGADGSAVDAIGVSAALDSTGAGVQAVGMLAQLDDVATAAVTENQFAAPRLSTRRALLVEGVASGTAVIVNNATAANLKVDASGVAVPITDNAGSLTVDNNGTFVAQIDGAALTSLQLIDDPVKALGTDTYSEGTTKGMIVGAVRRDADTTLADTTNEIAPLQVDSRGALKVEVFSGEALPVTVASVPSHAVTNAGVFAAQIDGVALTALQLIDDPVFADDAAFTIGTSKVNVAGAVAVAHGSNPDAADALDAVAIIANRHRVPFVIGGHPNIVTVKHTTITTAVTDAAIVTVAGGLKIVVTSFCVTLDNNSTVFPTVLIGFAAANTPTTTGVIGAHGGVPAGGGFSRGDGSGIIGIGADGEDLRVTTTGNATGNGLQIVVTYYTIES